ncbi:hypothetical protein BD626DRAFT_636662 [Schizophyllum amplum]|uniref:Uncharacterized protein n=1 Tax=Schizophyllum amplum TaxID=97359 RepID=A0A550BT17_9AGAR|nr:hypothetical protein BD626DRAFT_636662 [Auriculariopsis ampla]
MPEPIVNKELSKKRLEREVAEFRAQWEQRHVESILGRRNPVRPTAEERAAPRERPLRLSDIQPRKHPIQPKQHHIQPKQHRRDKSLPPLPMPPRCESPFRTEVYIPYNGVSGSGQPRSSSSSTTLPLPPKCTSPLQSEECYTYRGAGGTAEHVRPRRSNSSSAGCRRAAGSPGSLAAGSPGSRSAGPPKSRRNYSGRAYPAANSHQFSHSAATLVSPPSARPSHDYWAEWADPTIHKNFSLPDLAIPPASGVSEKPSLVTRLKTRFRTISLRKTKKN